MRPALGLVLALLAGAAQAVVLSSIRYPIPEARYSISVPRGWQPKRDVREDKRSKVYGVLLVGPRADAGVASKISVDFYAPGNTLFPDADAFLKRSHSDGVVPLSGEKTGPIVPAILAGLRGRKFQRKTSEFTPPDSPAARETRITEDTFVAPARGGFFVLTYSAPDALYARGLKSFDAVAASLTLK